MNYPLKLPIVGYTDFESARDNPILLRHFRHRMWRGYATPWSKAVEDVLKNYFREFEHSPGQKLYHPLSFWLSSDFHGLHPRCHVCDSFLIARLDYSSMPDRYSEDENEWAPSMHQRFCQLHAMRFGNIWSWNLKTIYGGAFDESLRPALNNLSLMQLSAEVLKKRAHQFTKSLNSISGGNAKAERRRLSLRGSSKRLPPNHTIGTANDLNTPTL